VADDRARRLRIVREKLVDAHLDGILLSGLSNVRFLTGFSGSNALLFISARDSVLLTDFRYQSQAGEQVGDAARVRIESASLWDGLWAELATMSGIDAIGFESMHLLHRDFQRLLEAGTRWHWRPTSDLIESVRERKEPAEVERIRVAAGMATRALGATLPRIRPGMTELEVNGLLEQELREQGTEAHPFPAIVASGPRSALPHAQAGNRAIAQGDFLLLDFGATAEGYCSDITRTVVVGRASERQREVYGAVREANEVARAQVRAGLSGKEADAIAREVLASRGLGEAFGHGLGHGLGLDVHEAPRLSRISEAVLPEDAVVTIEPGVYIPGWGGVRIEDDVHLSASGAVVLTEFPRDLLELN
jgi:Xaa-Pro aminopeptidase